jgi:dihydroorotate dehydrogenase
MGPAVRIGDVELSFCVMNAASTWSTTAEELVALAKSNAGAVVVRTTTLHPFLHPEFRSLHNPGYDRYLPLLTELAAYHKPLVASIAGASVEEYVTLARAFAEAGARLIEVNLAEPYVAATLCPWDDHEALVRLLVAVRSAAGRPILVKCPERIPLALEILRRALCDAGAEGVVLANTFAVMEKFLLVPGPGPAVVALGGVRSGYDLATTLRKGAGAVQLSAALAVEGPSVFARLAREHAALTGGHTGRC